MTRRALAAALVLATAGCDARSAGTAARPEVIVTGWRWDMARGRPGFCEGGGYLRNSGRRAIADVRLSISFYDATDRALATGEVGADKTRLDPGEQSSFRFTLPCPDGSESAELKATHSLGAPLIVHLQS